MRLSQIAIVSCFAFSAVSCKPSSATERTPDEKLDEDITPVIVQDAVWDKSKNEIALTLTEQEAYDASLLEITLRFFRFIDGEFIPSEDLASSRWSIVPQGDMATPSPELIISDLKTFDRLIVDLTYASEQIGSRTFDFNNQKENNPHMATPRNPSD